jgi:hypothetical protein
MRKRVLSFFHPCLCIPIPTFRTDRLTVCDIWTTQQGARHPAPRGLYSVSCILYSVSVGVDVGGVFHRSHSAFFRLLRFPCASFSAFSAQNAMLWRFAFFCGWHRPSLPSVLRLSCSAPRSNSTINNSRAGSARVPYASWVLIITFAFVEMHTAANRVEDSNRPTI